ncbi:hypothetical protein BDP81DRAFT_514032 [Colletotrichum phormii]|uniref:Uncharacterized protein n=1 Tax=Colletotrichum phormii TaxID=359342 RepID=A0AAJ0EH03_9PEZI|nr:uncharacterized protein BDP81DRAFT_514032 [Colletotrichum phormii]KAK1638693.1 hypothetical protein BDP81DRAFT_514032 [Colletotrichum phormii]
MSGRVQKRYSKDSDLTLRSAYDDVFDRFGSNDIMPYTQCFRAKRVCRIAKGANTCQGYKNLKRPYDGLVVASSRKLSNQRQEWEEKEEQASDALLGLHKKLT